jgi:hypothetical protein
LLNVALVFLTVRFSDTRGQFTYKITDQGFIWRDAMRDSDVEDNISFPELIT